MDLLKFGMEYEKSKSKLVRAAAKKALEIEIKRADRYEAYPVSYTQLRYGLMHIM